MSDFTKKDPEIRKPLQIDHETGEMVMPGFGRLPLVGPTSGAEYERLKETEAAKKQFNKRLIELMKLDFLCTQCKRKVPGHQALVGFDEKEQIEILVCPLNVTEGKCRGPLVPCKPGAVQ